MVENFYKVEKYANIKVVICYRKVFDIKRLKKNFGSYFTIIIGLLFVIIMIINFLTINSKIVKIIQLLFDNFNLMIKELEKKEKEKEEKRKKEKQKENKKMKLKEKNKKKKFSKVRLNSESSKKILNIKGLRIESPKKILNRNKININSPKKNYKKEIILNKVSKKYILTKFKNNKDINNSNHNNNNNNNIDNNKPFKKNDVQITCNPKKNNNNKKDIYNKDIISLNSVQKKVCNTITNINLLNSTKEKFFNESIKTNSKQKNIKIKMTSNNNNLNLRDKIKIKEEIKIIDKIINLIQKKDRIKYFNDDELNSLKYKEALKIDFRTYGEFYFSLLKQTHLIIFTFFVKNDYNLFLLKLSLFLISFNLFLFMNTLFFSDDSLHKIYKDEGKYDFLYHIPQIMYSTILSKVIS